MRVAFGFLVVPAAVVGPVGARDRGVGHHRATSQTPDVVQENQAFTWNPSLTGTKSEDTILAAGGGIEMITRPVSYPTISVEAGGIAFARPDILEKD